jgi:hypothetical protein
VYPASGFNFDYHRAFRVSQKSSRFIYVTVTPGQQVFCNLNSMTTTRIFFARSTSQRIRKVQNFDVFILKVSRNGVISHASEMCVRKRNGDVTRRRLVKGRAICKQRNDAGAGAGAQLRRGPVGQHETETISYFHTSSPTVALWNNFNGTKSFLSPPPRPYLRGRRSSGAATLFLALDHTDRKNDVQSQSVNAAVACLSVRFR